MAYDNTEVEIKIKIDQLKFNWLKDFLTQEALFISEVLQIDKYFSPSNQKSYLEEKYPYKWLSIRQRGNKNILNFKHFYPEKAQIHTHCNEYETQISDVSSLLNIFSELAIVELVEVKKLRTTFLFRDEAEIALDNVEQLGYFVEIEAVRNFGNIQETRKMIFDIAKELNLDVTNSDLRGYPFQLLKKQKSKKN